MPLRLSYKDERFPVPIESHPFNDSESSQRAIKLGEVFSDIFRSDTKTESNGRALPRLIASGQIFVCSK